MSEFFRRMSNPDFFLQNTFCVNALFSGCTSNVIYLFFAWHKKFAQNPENCTLDSPGVRTGSFFVFSSILRAGKKAWVDEFNKKKLWISTKCPTFSDKVFFEIFSCTHFFPNFSEKPSWPFLAKITFSGHFRFSRKIHHFFSEKIVIFFDFFPKKKFAKKHKKTWFCKKCVGRFQGRLQKVQKKTWEKSGFLLF